MFNYISFFCCLCRILNYVTYESKHIFIANLDDENVKEMEKQKNYKKTLANFIFLSDKLYE